MLVDHLSVHLGLNGVAAGVLPAVMLLYDGVEELVYPPKLDRVQLRWILFILALPESTSLSLLLVSSSFRKLESKYFLYSW